MLVTYSVPLPLFPLNLHQRADLYRCTTWDFHSCLDRFWGADGLGRADTGVGGYFFFISSSLWNLVLRMSASLWRLEPLQSCGFSVPCLVKVWDALDRLAIEEGRGFLLFLVLRALDPLLSQTLPDTATGQPPQQAFTVPKKVSSSAFSFLVKTVGVTQTVNSCPVVSGDVLVQGSEKPGTEMLQAS